MTKEELEKATGQELIEQRNYCGVDGYYGDYLDDVNAEMFKRFNRLEELEKENAELKETCNKWFEHLKNREEELLNELNNQNAKYESQIEEFEKENGK
jgi:predicted nuclease with TOPRIM domain